MHKMFDLTTYQKDHTCRKRTCLLPSVSLVMLQSLSISDKRKFLVFRSDISSTEVSLPEVRIDNRSSGTLQKVHDRKTDCFALLRRITKLTCVNSEVKSVRLHIKQGSLNRVHGTNRSHHGNHTRQELDHCSAPSGTESHNM